MPEHHRSNRNRKKAVHTEHTQNDVHFDGPTTIGLGLCSAWACSQDMPKAGNTPGYVAHRGTLNVARCAVVCFALPKNCIAHLAWMNMPWTDPLCWHSPKHRKNYKLLCPHCARGKAASPYAQLWLTLIESQGIEARSAWGKPSLFAAIWCIIYASTER